MSARAVSIVCGATLSLLGALSAAQNGEAPAPARLQVDGGDAGGLPRAPPQSEHVDVSGLERAAHDVSARGLKALVVMRNGHIVFERYDHGLGGDSVVDSGPFAQVLVALLCGTALQDGVLQPQALNGFDANRLRAAIESGAQQPYATYLSRKLWRRLNAAPAWIALPASGSPIPADCCFQARVLDWMRVASLLLDDGRFEGTQVVPRGWVERMLRPVSADGQHGFGLELSPARRGLYWLRGPGRWRLWLLPQSRVAVLFGADAPTGAAGRAPWDEARLLDLVLSTMPGQSAQPGDALQLQQLVPAHAQ